MKQWMAIYTKPRSEKKVAERLEARGFEIYCPLQLTIRQWSDRKKKVKVPIFPSYVFVHVEEGDRLPILQDPGVLNFVYWLGKPAIIRDEEIEAVREFHSSSMIGSIEVYNYEVGDTIDVRAGAFIGMKGTVSKLNRDSVTVLIESINMVMKVTLQSKYIQPD